MCTLHHLRNVPFISSLALLRRPPGRSSSPSQQNGSGARHPHGPAAHDHVEVAAHDSDLSFATDDMRARMTIALDDPLPAHPDMAALFEQKLAIEGASPKPCIVPGNALQLIDDDPAASRAHTPASVILLDPEHAPAGSADSSAEPEPEPTRRPIPRVRFRSRVRITSGVRRSRAVSEPVPPGASPASSASDSPSSSISAPLRWQADENAAWGPLGRRLSAYAHQNGWQKRVPSAPRSQLRPNGHHRQQPQAKAKVDERTPLVRPGRHVSYVDAGLDGGGDADDERVVEDEFEDSDEEMGQESALRAAALKREEDAVFGQWPWRVFNRHVRTHILRCH